MPVLPLCEYDGVPPQNYYTPELHSLTGCNYGDIYRERSAGEIHDRIRIITGIVMIPDPFAAYHELLSGDPQAAVEDYRQLVEGMERERLMYRDTVIPVLIQPYFTSSTFYSEIAGMIGPIERGLNRIIDLTLGNLDEYSLSSSDLELVAEIQQAFGLTETEVELMQLDCGTDRHIVIHRLDLYTGKQLHILEFNTDSAAGILETDIQIRLFMELPTLKRFSRSYSLTETDGAGGILQALLDVQYPGKGKYEPPAICLIDWDDVGTRSEQENLVTYFRTLDYPAFLADPRTCEFRNGALYAGDERIQIIHRRVITSELASRITEVRSLVDAIREGAVAVVNPFSSALGSNKVILAILSDERFHHLLEEDTVEVIRTYLPWTRQFHSGIDHSLISQVLEFKEGYVLKKGRSYGGSAVFVGRESDPDDWKTRIDAILSTEDEHWIVQEYIEPPAASFPVIRNGQLTFSEMIFNINPFIIGGEIVNGMARLNFPDREVINVARGGFQVPMIQTDTL